MTLRLRFCAGFIACLNLASHALLAHDPHDPMAVVAVSPAFATDHTVVAATGLISVKLDLYVLLKSTDGGIGWSVCGIPTNQPLSAIVFSPSYSSDGTIFAAGAGGIFRSTDFGTTWAAVESGPLTPGTPVSSLALLPGFDYNTNTRTVFAATAKKILRSTDGGATWTRLPAQPAPLTSNLSVLAVSPNYGADKTLLAGTAANGIFESTNRGNSWTAVTPGLNVSVTALAFSPEYASDATVFAGTFGSGVWISRSGGTSGSWTIANLPDNSVTAIALSQNYASDGALWATTADKSGNNGGVFQSTNQGAAWTGPATVSRELAANQTHIHYQTIAAGGGSGGVLFLGMFEGLWMLPSGAASWQYVDTLPTRLVRYIHLNSAANQTVFASTYGGGNLWSSTPGPSWNFSWTYQNTGMPLSYTDASGLSPNFANDGIAFSGVFSGLLETTNGNAARPAWAVVKGGLPSIYPRALAISPNFASDQTLFAGAATKGSSGLWRSTNGGASWTQPPSLAGPAVVSMALSPAFTPSNGIAFAVSNDAAAGGIYKSADGGSTWARLSTLAQAPMDHVAVSSNYPNDQTVLAAYATGGVMQSTDGGATWTAISTLAAIRALDIEFSPNYASDHTFYVGTLQQGLLRSTNGVWTPAALQDNLVTAVALTPNFNFNTSNRTMLAASYHGLYQSSDGGSTWTDTGMPARNEESRSSTDPASAYAPPTITYGNANGGTGSWTSVTSSQNASTSHWMKTTVSGDTAILDFVGSGVVWVSLVGPDQGTAIVELNGVQYNVNLNSSADQYQYPVWVSPLLPCAPYVLTLTATPQGGKGVSVDAFDVSSVNCPWAPPLN